MLSSSAAPVSPGSAGRGVGEYGGVSAQQAGAKRKVGHERDPAPLTGLERRAAGAIEDVEAVLDGGDRSDRLRLVELLDRDAAQAQLPDVAGEPQFGERRERLRQGVSPGASNPSPPTRR